MSCPVAISTSTALYITTTTYIARGGMLLWLVALSRGQWECMHSTHHSCVICAPTWCCRCEIEMMLPDTLRIIQDTHTQTSSRIGHTSHRITLINGLCLRLLSVLTLMKAIITVITKYCLSACVLLVVCIFNLHFVCLFLCAMPLGWERGREYCARSNSEPMGPAPEVHAEE